MFVTVSLLYNRTDLAKKFDPNPVVDKKLTGGPRLFLATIVVDAFISITALVIGILGLVGILYGIPPAASYTLIGLSGLITLTWIAFAITTKGKSMSSAAAILKAAISSDPKLRSSK